MSTEQISILRRAIMLKSTLGTRTAARYLRSREVPVTIAAMVLARAPRSVAAAAALPDAPG